MRAVMKYLDAALPDDAGLPTFTYTEYERTLMNLKGSDGRPMITNWLDADRKYFSADGTIWMDKVNRSKWAGPTAPAFTTDAHDNPLITMNGNHHFNPGDAGQMPNVPEWTWIVAMLDIETRSQSNLTGAAAASPSGSVLLEFILTESVNAPEMAMRIGSTGGFRKFRNQEEYGGAGPILFACSFSTTNGTTFHLFNANFSHRTSGATTNLSDRRWQIGRLGASSGNRFRGKIGEIMVVRADLWASANAGLKAAIAGAMVAKYGAV